MIININKGLGTRIVSFIDFELCFPADKISN